MSDMRYAVTISAAEVMTHVHVRMDVWEYPADPNLPDKRVWRRSVTLEPQGQPASADWVQSILEALQASL